MTNITQAILPVAGLGTRFFPWTKAVPKELLPIGNRPIVAHLVDECLDIGITDICFVISKGKEAIPQYFYPDLALEEELKRRKKEDLLTHMRQYDKVKIHVVYQTEQLGDGHAILQAKDWVNSETVAILFGDDLIADEQSGLRQIVGAYSKIAEGKRGAMLCLENIAREDTKRYGIAAVEDPTSSDRIKRVTGLVEKPEPKDAPSTLGIVGKYLIPRSTFDVLPTVAGSHGGEIRLIDALMHQLKEGLPIHGCEVRGMRIDTGTPRGYQKAVALWDLEKDAWNLE